VSSLLTINQKAKRLRDSISNEACSAMEGTNGLTAAWGEAPEESGTHKEQILRQFSRRRGKIAAKIGKKREIRIY